MKKFMVMICCLSLVLSLAACTRTQEPETTQGETVASAHNATFSGVLEDKKDFMIVVTGDNGDTHLFNLGDLECDAQVGDRITVTYNGDIEDFDAQLLAVKIVKE